LRGSFALLVLLAYSTLFVALGLWIGRRARAGEFFVAGRSLGPGLVVSTFLAANIGASSTVGATSLGYAEGLSAWWWNGSAGLGSLVLAFWVGPRMWREAVAHGDLTVGDFLERRYGRAMRGLVAVLIWLGTLTILAAQLLGVAAVLNVVGNFSLFAGCAIGALVTVSYFTAGGLLSSAWVNLVQLLVILAGFAVALPFALHAAGGWDLVTATGGSRTDVWASTGPGSGWRLLFLLGPAFIVSPGLLQKAYGARDERAVRHGIAWNGAALMLFACAPAAIGLAAHTLYPGLAKPDLALPTILADALPPAVGMIALAAVFSAEVSSADAVLFMLATSASRDLYRGFVRPAASEEEVLRVARMAAVVGSICGVGVAMVYGSVRAAVGVFYAILTVTLFVPILGALIVRGAGRVEGLASVLTGVPVLAAVHYLSGGQGYGVLSPALAGVLASAAAFAFAHALAPRPTTPPLNPTSSADKIPQQNERKGAL
jgi:SSS family solute:Na+ symporter